NNANVMSFGVNGTAEPGATVQLAVTDGTTTVTAAPSALDGTWSVTGLDLSGLADGTVTFTATAVDAAGNPSLVTSQPVTKDTLAPAAPSLSATDADNGNTVGVSGTGVSGDTVALTVVSDGGGIPVTQAVPVDDSNAYAAPTVDVSTL